MDLIEAIETRRSIRAFKSTPIPEEVLKKVLLAAGHSPSYANSQPWEVAVVTGKKKDEISKAILELAKANAPAAAEVALPGAWPPAIDQRVKEHNANRFKALGIERQDDERRKEQRLANYEFYKAPCVLYLFVDATLGPWAIFDMGSFAHALILAAHSLGLATCLQASVTYYPDTVRQILGIPKSKRLVLGISLGYPLLNDKLNAYRSARAPLDAFVSWYH
jgi:nitroreductase